MEFKIFSGVPDFSLTKIGKFIYVRQLLFASTYGTWRKKYYESSLQIKFICTTIKSFTNMDLRHLKET
jgi:hypothetical protein